MTASELLDVWDRGQRQGAHERALTMLAAVLPDRPEGLLGELSIGRRDGLLLTLWERTFGPTLTAVTECPRCGEPLEVAFGAAAIRAEPPPEPPAERWRAEEELEADGYRVRFRAPSTADLAAIAGEADVGAARAALLARCVVAASHGGRPRSAEDLPSRVVDALAARLAAADPQADVRLAMSCPSCAAGWEELFDVAWFLWNEICARAPRLLRDVHALASAYGWREADILAMGPRRRQAYLELVGG